jgi:hypothetical protein
MCKLTRAIVIMSSFGLVEGATAQTPIFVPVIVLPPIHVPDHPPAAVTTGYGATIETQSGRPFSREQYRLVQVKLREIKSFCQQLEESEAYLDCVDDGVLAAYERQEFGPNIRMMSVRARRAAN